MNKEQIRTLQSAGFLLEEIPTVEQPKMTFWRKEKTLDGEGKVVVSDFWIEMPNLPADPQSMAKYLKRGFVPSKPEELKVKDSTCSICGKVCKDGFGLSSHMKAHKNEIKEDK